MEHKHVYPFLCEACEMEKQKKLNEYFFPYQAVKNDDMYDEEYYNYMGELQLKGMGND